MKFTEITVQMPHWSTLNILKPASVCKCPFIFLFTLNYGQVRIILRQSGDKVMLQGLDPQHCWPASTSTLPFHQDLSASCIDMNRYAMVGSELEEFSRVWTHEQACFVSKCKVANITRLFLFFLALDSRKRRSRIVILKSCAQVSQVSFQLQPSVHVHRLESRKNAQEAILAYTGHTQKWPMMSMSRNLSPQYSHVTIGHRFQLGRLAVLWMSSLDIPSCCMKFTKSSGLEMFCRVSWDWLNSWQLYQKYFCRQPRQPAASVGHQVVCGWPRSHVVLKTSEDNQCGGFMRHPATACNGMQRHATACNGMQRHATATSAPQLKTFEGRFDAHLSPCFHLCLKRQWDIRVDLISNQLGRAFILSIRFNILSADSCSIIRHSFKRWQSMKQALSSPWNRLCLLPPNTVFVLNQSRSSYI